MLFVVCSEFVPLIRVGLGIYTQCEYICRSVWMRDARVEMWFVVCGSLQHPVTSMIKMYRALPFRLSIWTIWFILFLLSSWFINPSYRIWKRKLRCMIVQTESPCHVPINILSRPIYSHIRCLRRWPIGNLNILPFLLSDGVEGKGIYSKGGSG